MLQYFAALDPKKQVGMEVSLGKEFEATVNDLFDGKNIVTVVYKCLKLTLSFSSKMCHLMFVGMLPYS